MRGRNTKELAAAGLCAASMFAGQVALASLPNVEIVSLLVICFTLAFGRKVLFVIYTFVLLEGIFYGFGIWWVSYLYVWTILALAVMPFRRMDSAVFFALISGFFGLFFGAFCSLPYLIAGGAETAFAYWISGLPFDLVHCAGNFFLCLVLFKPVSRVVRRLVRQIGE